MIKIHCGFELCVQEMLPGIFCLLISVEELKKNRLSLTILSTNKVGHEKAKPVPLPDPNPFTSLSILFIRTPLTLIFTRNFTSFKFFIMQFLFLVRHFFNLAPFNMQFEKIVVG